MDAPLQSPGGGPHPAVPVCNDVVCITCSDAAIAVRVIELGDRETAVVDTGGSLEVVSVALVDVAPGDTVLVHAGEAIAVVSGV